MLTTNIRKWGNSQGLYIPKELLRELGISVNDHVTLCIENGAIVIKRFDGFSTKQKAVDSLRAIRDRALTNDNSDREDHPDYRKEYEDYLDERYGK